MNQRVVFFKHAVETLTYFSRQLALQLEAWGCEIFWMDIQMLGLDAWKLRQTTADGKETILVTFNFIGLSGEEGLWELDDEGEPAISLWEKLDIRCLNIMVDHPIYYYEALQYRLPHVCMFCVDRNHVAYMERFYPGIRCAFLPLAGNCLLNEEISPMGLQAQDEKASDTVKSHSGPDFAGLQTQHVRRMPHKAQSGQHEGLCYRTSHKAQSGQQEGLCFEQWMERPYPVVFTANYVPVSNIDQQLRGMEPEYRDFYYEIIDAFIHNPKQDLLSCIEAYLRREMPDLSDAQLCEGMSNMPTVDLWIRTYFREKTMRMLVDGGIKVHIFGKDWDQVPCKHPGNMVLSGHMAGSADCVQAMAMGKIALNTMPWFKDGAHDRIFTAMLQGATALTDDSVYLREQFRDGETLLYYDLEKLEELPQQVSALFQNPQRLFEISCRGKAVAGRFHTWGCRAQILRDYM